MQVDCIIESLICNMEKLKISNFRKINTDWDIDFSPTTFLTGTNNSGKSSIIKAVLLLKDYFDSNNLFEIDFNKGLNKLNHKITSFNNAKSWYNKNKNTISFEYKSKRKRVSISFSKHPTSKTKAILKDLTIYFEKYPKDYIKIENNHNDFSLKTNFSEQLSDHFEIPRYISRRMNDALEMITNQNENSRLSKFKTLPNFNYKKNILEIIEHTDKLEFIKSTIKWLEKYPGFSKEDLYEISNIKLHPNIPLLKTTKNHDDENYYSNLHLNFDGEKYPVSKLGSNKENKEITEELFKFIDLLEKHNYYPNYKIIQDYLNTKLISEVEIDSKNINIELMKLDKDISLISLKIKQIQKEKEKTINLYNRKLSKTQNNNLNIKVNSLETDKLELSLRLNQLENEKLKRSQQLNLDNKKQSSTEVILTLYMRSYERIKNELASYKLLTSEYLNNISLNDALEKNTFTYPTDLSFILNNSKYHFDQFYEKKESVKYNLSKRHLDSYFKNIERNLLNIFDFEINYLPPFRYFQEAYYLNRISSNDTVFNQLVRKYNDYSLEAKEFIHKWMKEFDIGENLQIKIDHKHDSDIGFIVETKTSNGNYINIKDKGYGSGQILTILLSIGYAIKNKKLVENRRKKQNYPTNHLNFILIEEPECNLHPALQSKLGELFYESSKKHNIYFVVETHSEYLLRKSQNIHKNHIEQNKSNKWLSREEKYQFNAYYISEETGIYSLEYNDNGKFKNRFGTGFFDENTKLTLEMM